MTPNEREFSYDSIAATYARKVDTAPFNELYERPAMLGLLGNVDGARILDAGCGSGWYSEELLARGAIVDAVDASAAMVGHARTRVGRLPPETRARWSVQVCDLAVSLPFATGVFDGAVSPLVLHYIRDWRPALREIHRVLRPGGWLQFSTHHPSADAAHFETTDYFATEHVKDHWDWVGDVEFFRRSLTEISASLADSGFAIDLIVEPRPSAEFRAKEPEWFPRLMRQPEFLIVKCTRRN